MQNARLNSLRLRAPVRHLKSHTGILFLLAWCVMAPSLRAADSDPRRRDNPPNRPYSPQEALARMTVPEGFSVELVASEPEIVNPIAMTFDDRGRIWVTESIEYPRRSAGPGRDRIKILEDTDRDGRADKVATFAEGLNIPTGIAIGYGGAWIMNAPDLLFMKEKDGKAASREVVLTGFGRTDTHQLPSSLRWGPDGWLYGLNGVFNQSHVQANGREFEFTCAMWRIHPHTREFQVFCAGTSNPYGIAWEQDGSAIVEACHWPNDHLFHFVESGYYQRQAGTYPPFTYKIGAITDHSHQGAAYCGIAFFDSAAYPFEYRERIYMGNIHGGCINVDRLHRDGSTYIASAEPDFLTAHDAWFMPVAQSVGPDGCLYVLDWYDRYHCYEDASRDSEGIDRLRGRLYRVRYKDTPRAPEFDLARESDDQLIARLASPNIYYRETAQRLLSERGGDGVKKKLRALIGDRLHARKARLHALWALIGTGSIEPAFHEELLQSGDATFRAWGVRAAGNFHQVTPAIREQVKQMARDASADVQLQVAIAAPKIEGLDSLPLLMDVLRHCGQDTLIPAVVWPNLHPLMEARSDEFVKQIQQTNLQDAPAVVGLLPRSIERLLSARHVNAKAVETLLQLLSKH